jgi:dTMP kinase
VTGLFIVFEGVEGCGKTTQLGLLADWLEGRGIPHVVAREPGGTAVGEAVRQVLLHGEHVDARAELLLYLAARAQLLAEMVRPALAAGRLVLTDRYELSTFAYQGAGRRLHETEVRALNRFATTDLRPDLTLVLSVPRTVAASRLAGRAGHADRLEREDREFHERVAAAYDALGKTEPGVEIVDGAADTAVVHAAVVRLLLERFPETFAKRPG